MPSSADRRLVILAEGNFGFHHGKTAMGVIRFGTDRVRGGHRLHPGRAQRPRVARRLRAATTSRSSRASTRRSGFLPRANGLLIGIAPTGGRLPDDWRAVILAAIRSGLDIHSGLHTFLGDDPEFADAARSSRRPDHRLPPAARPVRDGRRAGATRPGKRVILTVGTDCAIGKMSVALELRRAATAAGRDASFVRHGPDRDDGRGLGRGRRPGHRRLRPGDGGVAGRRGRAPRRLGHRRGAGEPGPPGVQLGDAGAHPRDDARTRWSWSTSPGMADHDFDHEPDAPLPDRAAAAVHRAPRAGRRARRARRRSWRSRSTRRSSRTRRRRGGSSRPPRPRPACRATTRCASAASRCGARSRRRSTRCRG